MSKLITGIILFTVFTGLYIFIAISGLADDLFNSKNLQSFLVSLNGFGPLLIVMLMTGAIVMSPLPSAPIAIAAGFAYGHGWGTFYILIGAELGAIIAFTISRLLGYQVIQKRFGHKIDTTWLSSSKHLVGVIFVSRLIPFISFDVISYAAGLTKVSYLQFALATFFGILPASFLLAHVGSEIATSELNSIAITVILLGVITVFPLVFSLILKRKSNE